METRANYALIGAFTLAVIASAFMFVFWFSGGEKAKGRKTYRIVFTGSVSGLSRGAQVLFNGLRVGEVTSLGLMDEDPSRVAASVDIDSRTPVKTDTHAQLEFTGLTGIASIALTGGGVATPALVSATSDNPVIYADKSDIQNLLANVQTLTVRADSILAKADSLLGEGDGSIKQILKNAEIFSKALADNAGGVGDFLASAGDIGRSLKPLASKLDGLATDVDVLVKAADPKRVAAIIEKIDTVLGDNGKTVSDILSNTQVFSKSLADSSPAVNEFVGNVADLGRSLKPLSAKIDGLTDNVTGIVKAVDSQKIADIIDKVDGIVGGNAAALTDTLHNAQVFSKALADSSQGITDFLNAMVDLSKQASPLAVKLNGIADNAGALVSAIDPVQVKNLVGDSANLAKKLNTTADSANAVLAAIDNVKLQGIVDDAAEASKKLKTATDSANAILASVDAAQIKSIVGNTADLARKLSSASDSVNAVFAAIDGAQVKAIVGDAASLAKKLNVTADSANAVIAAVDSAKIAGVVDDAADISRKLNGTAGKVDILVNTAQGLLGSPETRGTLTEIADAARSIRKLADNLDVRTRDIATGITRFTGQGLRQVENLATDSRRTLEELNRTARGLQKNPQQLIFGTKPAIPEYSGK